jgi:hypothetical protein
LMRLFTGVRRVTGSASRNAASARNDARDKGV